MADEAWIRQACLPRARIGVDMVIDVRSSSSSSSSDGATGRIPVRMTRTLALDILADAQPPPDHAPRNARPQILIMTTGNKETLDMVACLDASGQDRPTHTCPTYYIYPTIVTRKMAQTSHARREANEADIIIATPGMSLAGRVHPTRALTMNHTS